MNFYEAVMERRSGEDRRRIDRELDEARRSSDHVDWAEDHRFEQHPNHTERDHAQYPNVDAEDQLEVLTGSTRR